MQVLTDDDVRTRLTPRRAIDWMREALAAASDGRLVAPARVSTVLGAGRLVFTTGALTGHWYGYRSYDTFGGEPVGQRDADQVVVVHEWSTGLLRGCLVGWELSPRRVAAIGAVAVDLLAPAGATSLGVVGTGRQAWTQVWAIAAVRPLTEVVVHSRDADRREAFAVRVRDELGLACRAVGSARDAVEGRDLVVLATSSPTPVVEPAWLAPGAWVSTLGPKLEGRAEFGPELADWADVLVTDSVQQVEAYDPPFVLAGTPAAGRLPGLGDLVTGRTPAPGAGSSVLFCSVGLAGTEAYLAARLLEG